MRVLLAVRKYSDSIGGVETHVRKIAESLAARGNEILILTSSRSPVEIGHDSVQLLTLPEHLARTPFAMPGRGLTRLIDGASPDILHVHGAHGLFFALVCAASRNAVPVVVTPHYHGAAHQQTWSPFLRIYRPVLQWCLDLATAIIAVSTDERNLLRSHFRIPSAKITLIPNGIEKDELDRVPYSRHRNHRILYVGRIEPYKNVDKLLKSLPIVARYHPDVSLTIATPRGLPREIAKLASGPALRDRVVVVTGASRKELLKAYTEHEVFVMPSTQEAYSIATAEAAYLGLKLLVTDTSGLGQYLRMGMSTSIPLPVDEGILAQKIIQTLGNESFPTTQGQYFLSWTDVAAKVEELYSVVLNRNQGAG